MINLVRAELQRLLNRRVALFAAIILVVIVGLFMVLVNFLVTPPSAADKAAAQQAYEQAVNDWEQAGGTAQIQTCVDNQEGSQQDCEMWYAKPTLDDFQQTAAPYADAVATPVQYGSLLALVVVFFVGASSIGAEYGSGAIANWLTFVPQRLKVLGSKLIAIALTSAVAIAVVVGLMLGIAAILTTAHGGDVSGAGPVAEMAGRAVALGALAGIIGLCLGLLTRHTVAALGIVLGYYVVSGVLSIVGQLVAVISKLPPWLPSANLTAFLNHGGTYSETQPQTGNVQDYVEPIQRTITFTHSAVYLAVMLVVVVALTGYVFRRRDVT